MANFDVAIKKEEILKYRCKVPNGYVRLSSVLGSLPKYADDDAAKAAGLKDCELYINDFGNITAYGRGAQSLSTYVSQFEFNEETGSLTVNLANGEVQQIDLSGLEASGEAILSDFTYNQLANQVTLEYVDGTTEAVTVPAPPAGETIASIAYTEGTPNTIVVTYTDDSTSTAITVTGISTQEPVVQSVTIDTANNQLVVTSIDSLGNTVIDNIPLADALQYWSEIIFNDVNGKSFARWAPNNNARSGALTVKKDQNLYIGSMDNTNDVRIRGKNNVVIGNRPGAGGAYRNEVNSNSTDRLFVAGNSNLFGGTAREDFVLGARNRVVTSTSGYIFGIENEIEDANAVFMIGRANKNVVNNNGSLHTNTLVPFNSKGDIGNFELCMKSPSFTLSSGVAATTTLRDNSNNSVINFGKLYDDFDEAILNVDLKVSCIITNSTATPALQGEGFTANVTGLIRLKNGSAPDLQLTASADESAAANAAGASIAATIVAASTDNLQVEVTVTPGAQDMVVHAYGVLGITYTAIA